MYAIDYRMERANAILARVQDSMSTLVEVMKMKDTTQETKTRLYEQYKRLSRAAASIEEWMDNLL